MSSNSSVPLIKTPDIDFINKISNSSVPLINTPDIDFINIHIKKLDCEQDFKREIVKVLKEISERLYAIEVEIANK